MTIPAIMTRFDFSLFETDAWDIDMAVDSQHHSPRVGTQGFRVLATGSTF